MGYEVRGGPGSIRYSITELERTGSMLGSAKEHLIEAAGLLARAPDFPAVTMAHGNAGLRRQTTDVENGIREATSLCYLRAAESGILALKVVTARARYEQAEAEAQRLVTRSRADRLPLTLLWDLLGNKGRPRTQTTEDLLNELPGFMGVPLGFLRGKEHGGLFQTPYPDRLYRWLTDLLRDQNLVDLSPIEVLGRGRDQTVDIDGSVESLVRLQKLAEKEPPGSLLVTRVERPEGPVYVLTLPGTQSDPSLGAESRVCRPDGTDSGQELGNPWDGLGLVEGMGNESRNLIPPIEDALRQSGARNGDRVVVSGYSQGGIHATNIVNDDHLNTLFSFSLLSTFGSPTGRIPVPKDTQALHLEDRNDLVPGTDGSPNPDERNRLTVVFDGPDGTKELGNDGFGEAHKLENYEAHAKELRSATDPGVVESMGLLGALFGSSGRGRVRSFQLARRPRSAVKLPGRDRKQDRLKEIAPPH